MFDYAFLGRESRLKQNLSKSTKQSFFTFTIVEIVIAHFNITA